MLDKYSCRLAQVDPRLGRAVTPLKVAGWEKRLRRHRDEAFVAYILRGLSHDFHLGVQEEGLFEPARCNMPSAIWNPEVIEDYFRKEVREGNMLGTFSPETAPKVHINRFEANPRNNSSGNGD